MNNLQFMNTGKYIFSILSLFLFGSTILNAQEEIHLSNPSFESVFLDYTGTPNCCIGAKNWFSCGKPDLNTPDAQPGNFGVGNAAAEGNYYLGMVARDNDSWEAISQRLRTPLFRGKCYTFSMKLSHSKVLVSQSRITDKDVVYDRPIVLRIWGGSGYCHKAELLDETAPIDHSYWKQYNFRFEPNKNFSFITIEAYYKTPTPIPYNGNVLMDDASSIKIVPCDEESEPDIVDIEQPVAEPVNISPTKPKTDPTPKPPVKPTPSDPIAEKPDPKPSDPNGSFGKILDLDRDEMKEGQVFRIKSLYFQADSSNIKMSAYPVLDELYNFLADNEDVTIEIGGHTNNRCETGFCDKLSEKRAKAVVDYLNDKGIRRNRLMYRGYGKRSPVATNATPTGRKRNQRVEFKILSLDG